MRVYSLFCFLIVFVQTHCQESSANDRLHYLDSVKVLLNQKFPDNRTINLVFHGHSVPSGYWSTPIVNSVESYPHLLLKKLKEKYPYAVINIITTSIGGENSEEGQLRFSEDVLPYKPDVLFIDYALNDTGIGLERAKMAWQKMIDAALEHHIKIILLSPSPDQRVNILDEKAALSLHAQQIKKLANENEIGLADVYGSFQSIMRKDRSIKQFMSHINHPNKKGHQVIVDTIFKLFE